MWIASGVFFSSQNFLLDATFIKALPLTAVIDALRANILQGSNLRRWLRKSASLPSG